MCNLTIDAFGIISLFVYKDERFRWVFDDKEKGIAQEPFVAGMDEVLDHLSKDIPNAVFDGFNLHIQEFIGSNERPTVVLCHHTAFSHPILGQSNYYYWEEMDRMKVWICPVLYRYVSKTPQILCLWSTSLTK